jgi:hypothetical protein
LHKWSTRSAGAELIALQYRPAKLRAPQIIVASRRALAQEVAE